MQGTTFYRLFLLPLKSGPARTYAATYFFNFLLVAAVLFGFRLAKTGFSEIEFAYYAVLRRYISFVIPLLCMGVGVALTRRVALASADSSEQRADLARLLFCALAIFGCALVPLALVGAAAPDALAAALWGDASRAALIRASLPAVAGAILHAAAYAYFRGRLMLIRAGLLNLLNLGLLPLAGLVVSASIEHAVAWSGWAVLGVSVASLAGPLAGLQGLAFRDVRQTCRELLSWGLPRVPGDLLLSLMLYLPIVLASHFYGLQQGGYVAYALSLLTLLQMIVSPVSVVLLPETAMLLSRGAVPEVRRRATTLLLATALLTACAVAGIVLGAPRLLTWHLTSFAPDLVNVARLACLVAVPYNVYICLRSVLDAASERAMNARNVCLAMAANLLFIGGERLLFPTPHGPVACLLAGAVVLAALTVYQTHRTLEQVAGGRRPTPTPRELPRWPAVESAPKRLPVSMHGGQ